MLLQAVVQQAQTVQPFFTNDGIGLVKIFALVFSIVGPLLALVYKLTFNETREKMGDMRRDLDGYGERVNKVELQQRGCDTKVGAMEQAQTRLDAAMQTTKVQMAEIRTSLNDMRQQQTELQRDIMSAIVEGNRATEKQLTDLKVDVARLHERAKLGEAMALLIERMDEIKKGGERQK